MRMHWFLLLPATWFYTYCLLLTASSAQTNITKPGCQRRCGNLTVPYPFGIGPGSGCAIGPGFEISCKASYSPPRPFIGTSTIRVREISDTQLRVDNVVAARCYDLMGHIVSDTRTMTQLAASPYTMSRVNTLTVIGCDDYALVTSAGGLNSTSSCVSRCSKADDVINGSCSGTGCCRTGIPRSLIKSYVIQLRRSSNLTGIYRFSPCAYAFIGEASRFDFRGASDFSDPDFPARTAAAVPLVLDWAIGNSSCNMVRKANDYACQAKSFCVDSDSGFGGYRCRCSHGFQGNPYLSPGCLRT